MPLMGFLANPRFWTARLKPLCSAVIAFLLAVPDQVGLAVSQRVTCLAVSCVASSLPSFTPSTVALTNSWMKSWSSHAAPSWRRRHFWGARRGSASARPPRRTNRFWLPSIKVAPSLPF
jgi:hypothetical protein